MVARPWKVYGPFELNKHSNDDWCDLLRMECKGFPKLTLARGAYVISVTNGSRDRIRYIGMTDKQDFLKEIFSARNRQCVWDIIQRERGRIRVYLFAKSNQSRSGYSVDHRLYRQSHLLEELLIMHARAAGHKLINTKKLKSAEGISVSGVFGKFNRGKPSAAVVAMKKALHL